MCKTQQWMASISTDMKMSWISFQIAISDKTDGSGWLSHMDRQASHKTQIWLHSHENCKITNPNPTIDWRHWQFQSVQSKVQLQQLWTWNNVSQWNPREVNTEIIHWVATYQYLVSCGIPLYHSPISFEDIVYLCVKLKMLSLIYIIFTSLEKQLVLHQAKRSSAQENAKYIAECNNSLLLF